jgi:hypothetical protein
LGPTFRPNHEMRSHNINRLNITRIHNAIWHPPLSPWIKCNTGSAAIGSPLNAFYGGIFQNSEGGIKISSLKLYI